MSLEQTDAGELNRPAVIDGTSPGAPQPEPLLDRRRLVWPWRIVIIILLFLLLAGLGAAIVINGRRGASTRVKAGDFKTQRVSFSDLKQISGGAAGEQLVSVNGGLQVAKSLVLSPTVQPTTAVTGGLYFDQTSKTLNYYNGTQFVSLTADTTGSGPATTIINNNPVTIVQGGSGGGNALNGTPGQFVKFTGPSSIGDSIAREDGLTVHVGGNINLVSTSTTPMNEIFALDPSIVPSLLNENDELRPLELGVKFRTDVSGFVRGIRFYKGNLNTGTHTGTLWTASGTQLATGTFTNETASGWQEMRFAAPVAVSADTTYIASYHSTAYYSATAEFFKTGGVDKESLHLLRDGDDGGNGVFNYGAGTTFPTRSSRASNYFVDVIFLPNPPPNRYQINGVQIASADLANNTDIAKRSASQIFTGNNTFRPSVNTASAFSIQTATGSQLFTVSSLEERIYVGGNTPSASPTVLVLSNKDTVGDPAGTEGAIYYNLETRSFRCYRSGVWDNCAQLEVDHSFAVYEEFLGGQNTSFATNNFGSLGWQAAAIGANGTVSYDPGTPAPTGDRPGVLALQTPAVANQGTTFYLGNAAGTILPSKDNIVKTAVAVGSTSQVVRIGLHNQASGTARPVSGVWWEADTSVNPNWQYCWGNGTAAICQPSSTIITADTWVRLELRIVATGAGTSTINALINGTFFQQQGTTIDSTTRISPAFSCYTTAASAANCYWDYYQLKGTTSAAR